MSYTATSTHKRPILRRNFGSLMEVVRVFAWCQITGRASVLLRDSDGNQHIETLPENELEAIDTQDRYVPLGGVLKSKAGVILK